MITDDFRIVDVYTAPMLKVASTPLKAFPRLLVQGVRAPAWIKHKPWRYGDTDWRLWIERDGKLTLDKCPLRLEIESRLRSWLLRECKLPLNTLSYDELRLIAEGRYEEARRIHAHSVNTLTARLDTPPIPHVSGFTG
jgi:hypothetical protein